jgi:type I restriction enzyme, S subunit
MHLVRLGDVAQINPRFDKSSLADDVPVSFVQMASVGAADGKINVSIVRPFAEVKKGSYTPFKDGDVLFAKVTPCMENGKMVVARGLKNGVGFGSSEFHVLRPSDQVDAKYLYYFVSSQAFRKEAAGHMTGAVGLRRVPAAFLSDAQLPMVQLDEQRRIVAEIEQQFSRLDEAVANLQRVKANLKRYKASVLKAAVEGRLVETEASIAQREGRSYESAQELIEKTQSPPRPNRFNSRTGDVILGHGALAVGIPPTSVPEGWQWVNLVEIAKMETGHTPSRGHPEWWGGDVPWIGIADARDHHERSILKTIQYTNSDGLANSAARLLPAGTVCVSRTASVGYVVVMGKPMATSQDFVNWIPTSAVISDWLRVIFTADRDALIRFGKGTVHKTIYFPEWLSASIALPPLTEQARIVAEVDRHLSIISEVESEVDANLRRTQALRQATLSNKFSGS